jgi:hypothetical protein
MVFDGNLYYQEGIYRTPTMMEMPVKWISYISKKRDNISVIPHSGVSGTAIEHLIPILTFFESLK